MVDGPVEVFLAELGRHLRRDDEARSRTVAEIGDHLRDLVAEGVAQGLGELAAETAAVERFGTPRALAQSVRPARRGARLGIAAALAGAGACALAIATLRTPAPPAPATPHIGHRSIFRPATGVVKPISRVIAIDPRTGTVLTLPFPASPAYAPGFTTKAGALFIGDSLSLMTFRDAEAIGTFASGTWYKRPPPAPRRSLLH
jgi:hypothetical protein